MGRRISGGWAQKRHTGPIDVPLVAPIDPEHLHPTANIDVTVGDPMWVQSDTAPFLPMDYTGAGVGQVVGGGGPLDHTPDDPNFGVGGGHGLTIQQSQVVMGELHGLDLGAVAAHAWDPITDRDGAPHMAIIYDTPGEGDSPQTLQLQRTGVGQPNDPYARTGKRIKRWWDRHIDMHWYDVERRPIYGRNAYTAQVQPPAPDGTQYDSPFPTLGPFHVTPDSFVMPQERTAPTTWNEPSDMVGVGLYGLGQWGL